MSATEQASRTVNAALRRAILAAVASARLRRFVGRYGMRLGAARFVAGETLDDCLDVLARAERERASSANTTILGEGVPTRRRRRPSPPSTSAILDGSPSAAAGERRGQADPPRARDRRGARLRQRRPGRRPGRRLGNFVRIDMEHSAVVDATLRIYRRLRESGHDNVGTVLQAYLYRSEDDLAALLPLQPNLRIVKGAYLEPPAVAYPRKADVDAAYARLARGGAARRRVRRRSPPTTSG